jgi:hypothetical protein
MPTNPKKRSSQRKGYPGPIYIHEEPVEVKVAKISTMGVIITGILGFIGVVITAIVAPTLIAYLQATPTPTPTSSPTITPILPTETEVGFTPVVFTDTPESFPSAVPSETSMPPSPTALPPTGEPSASKLTVVLTSSLDEGKSPLPVNFNAKNSFVQFADGSVAVCGQANFCTYTWAVYRDQKQVVAPFQGQGTFSYTLSGKGIYTVTVYVCRTTVCDDDGTQVTVR